MSAVTSEVWSAGAPIATGAQLPVFNDNVRVTHTNAGEPVVVWPAQPVNDAMTGIFGTICHEP